MKKCIICGIEKPLEDYYKHSKMGDGHLNKCKECCKSQAKKRELELRKDPLWVEKEKSRAREKYSRLGYKDKQKEWDADKPWKATSVYKNLNRDLRVSKVMGKHEKAHHWNYNKEHLSDIFIMSESLHRKLHTYLVFEKDSLIFSFGGVLLDTKEKHCQAIVAMKGIENIQENVREYIK